MCDMCVVSDICSWEMCVVTGCGVGVENLCVSICQCGRCVDLCVGVHVLVFVCSM